jgi:hypothetical protein
MLSYSLCMRTETDLISEMLHSFRRRTKSSRNSAYTFAAKRLFRRSCRFLNLSVNFCKLSSNQSVFIRLCNVVKRLFSRADCNWPLSRWLTMLINRNKLNWITSLFKFVIIRSIQSNFGITDYNWLLLRPMPLAVHHRWALWTFNWKLNNLYNWHKQNYRSA